VHSHIALLTLFTLLVATVFATLLRDDFREQLRLGGVILAGLALSAILFGWLMYPFPL
jgi:hypothetical protein